MCGVLHISVDLVFFGVGFNPSKRGPHKRHKPAGFLSHETSKTRPTAGVGHVGTLSRPGHGPGTRAEGADNSLGIFFGTNHGETTEFTTKSRSFKHVEPNIGFHQKKTWSLSKKDVTLEGAKRVDCIFTCHRRCWRQHFHGLLVDCPSTA